MTHDQHAENLRLWLKTLAGLPAMDANSKETFAWAEMQLEEVGRLQKRVKVLEKVFGEALGIIRNDAFNTAREEIRLRWCRELEEEAKP